MEDVMSRVVFTGGQVFDGTGAEPGAADVVVEGGHIVEVGTGLDGDQAVDCTGQSVLPGMFDCSRSR
jgi:N-acyl-D-aspartate/D-glutamate deacylase